MAIQAPVLFWRNSSETFILAGLGANSDFDLSFGALWFQASRAVVARERHISAQGKPGLLVDETSEIQLFPSSKKKKKDMALLTSTFQSREREWERVRNNASEGGQGSWKDSFVSAWNREPCQCPCLNHEGGGYLSNSINFSAHISGFPHLLLHFYTSASSASTALSAPDHVAHPLG